MGKVTSYDREKMSEAVLNNMVSGMSLRKASIAAGITAQTFLRWCDEDSVLAERYAHAREELIERMADELLEISDRPVGTTDSGATDSGAVQDKRLQVDTRKWLLSKLAPKKYGEKVTVAGDENSPLKIERIERVVVDSTATRVKDE